MRSREREHGLRAGSPTPRTGRLSAALGLLGLLLGLTGTVTAQSLTLSTTTSLDTVRAWNTFDIEVSLDTPSDLYFLAFDVVYDSTRFELGSVTPIGLFASGLHFSEDYSADSSAVSLTLTSALPSPTTGTLVRLGFLTVGDAVPGASDIRIRNVIASDSQAGDLGVSPVTPDTLFVKEFPNAFALSSFTTDTLDVTEGDSLPIQATLEIIGLTDDPTRAGELTLHLGVLEATHADISDPELWPTAAWSPMSLVSTSDPAAWVYEGESAWRRDPGTYRAVARIEFGNGDIYYAGVGGLLLSIFPSNHQGVIRIGEIGTQRYTIAAWNFNNQLATPSEALPVNYDAQVVLVGATLVGYTSGSDGQGFALSGRAWDYGIGLKHWLVSVATNGLGLIEVSSRMAGSNTGPRDFKIQSRDGAGVWHDVPGGTIVVANDNYESGRVTNLSVPDSIVAGDSLHLRWMLTSVVKTDGYEAISTTGTNKLDDIVITGKDANSVRVEVYPGDTDNNNIVQAEDVLPLGVHWLRSGPLPIYDFINFDNRATMSWLPLEATYADANADGVVNHLDLQPIGLNYGLQSGQAKQIRSKVRDPLLVDLPAMRRGEELTIHIAAEGSSMSGVAGEMFLQGLDPTALDMSWRSHLQPDLALSQHSDLLRFQKFVALEPMAAAAAGEQDAGRAESAKGIHFAEVIRRPLRDQQQEVMVSVRVKALQDVPSGYRFGLSRLTGIDRAGISGDLTDRVGLTLSTVVTSNEVSDELPSKTRLHQNHPNPFNPSTRIRFDLAEADHISLQVYNMLGQRMATLYEGSLQAGRHEMDFESAEHGLSSGMYLIKLVTSSTVQTRVMSLMK